MGAITDAITNNPLSALGGLLGGLGLYKAYSDLGSLGTTGYNAGVSLGNDLLSETTFQPYGITTGTGGQFNVNNAGQVTMSLTPEEQTMRQNLLTGAQDLYARSQLDPSARTGEIYDDMLAAMEPGMIRQRQDLEGRMAAQGRLGIRSNALGGMAPEDFQLSFAQQEAMNNARLNAMQQARAEQAQDAAIAQQMFGASYLPQAQLTAALQPGLTAMGQRQQAQLYGAGLMGQARASGIDALLGAGLGRANIVGSAATGLLSGLVN